jgi:hypothetical protein
MITTPLRPIADLSAIVTPSETSGVKQGRHLIDVPHAATFFRDMDQIGHWPVVQAGSKQLLLLLVLLSMESVNAEAVLDGVMTRTVLVAIFVGVESPE